VTADTEHLKALAAAMTSVDQAVKVLITEELTGLRPGLEQAVQDAAHRLRDATAALVLPEQQIAGMDAEITAAEAKAADWEAKTSDAVTEVRVEARRWFTAWNEELERLRQKRSQMGAALHPFTEERDKAKDALAQAEAALAGFELNLEAPYLGMGRQTAAYRAYRVVMGTLTPVLLAGDDSHPEWDVALSLMDDLCLASGYRTDHLPQDAGHHRRYWDNFRDAANPPEPAPSGLEVAEAAKAAVRNVAVNEALSKSPSRIDDYRKRAVPKPAEVRDYMQAPHVAAQMRGR
jgi:hypothetical protein